MNVPHPAAEDVLGHVPKNVQIRVGLSKLEGDILGFRLIPVGHKGDHAVVDAEDYEWLSAWAWDLKRGYATRGGTKSRVNGNRFMHRSILSARPGEICDHINGDTLDNRRCNLRIVTATENARNRRAKTQRWGRKPHAHYKGLSWTPHGFIVRIGLERKQIYLGTFQDEIEAALAYDRAALHHYGEHARLNFPEGSSPSGCNATTPRGRSSPRESVPKMPPIPPHPGRIHP